jgi:hypothetical protein
MVGWGTQVAMVAIQAPFLSIVPAWKKVPQPFDALPKEVGDLWIANLDVKVI